MNASDAFRFKPASALPEPDGIIAILIGLLVSDGVDAAVAIDGGAVLKLQDANLDAGVSAATYDPDFRGGVLVAAGDLDGEPGESFRFAPREDALF